MSIEDWETLLRSKPDVKAMALAILHHLDGYGFEYGYDDEEDADDLLRAFYAMAQVASTN